VSFEGRWHAVPDAGLNPLPVQRPIPIWFGGHAEAQLCRAARLADGWMPNYRSVADARPALDILSQALEEAGRSWADFGLEARIPYGDGNPDTWNRLIEEWRAVGATHIEVNTMGTGLRTPQDHLAALRRFAEGMRIER
jgi:alkanesulfonate monooxygenase SsuD/methylene tetrahydromethanopterin reductase-like flavin-dependent oxidoreductase (luciferase family)